MSECPYLGPDRARLRLKFCREVKDLRPCSDKLGMILRYNSARLTVSLLALAFVLNACTDAVPKVSQLKNLENFDLTSPQISTADLTTVSVVAKCSAYITGVELSFDAGVTWSNATAYDAASTLDCNNSKEFKITLSQTKAPWASMSIPGGTTLPVKFRATSRMGTQITRDLQVLFTPGSTKSQEILVGSQLEQTGAGLKLKSRLRFQKQEVATGGGYVLHGRISQ